MPEQALPRLKTESKQEAVWGCAGVCRAGQSGQNRGDYIAIQPMQYPLAHPVFTHHLLHP